MMVAVMVTRAVSMVTLGDLVTRTSGAISGGGTLTGRLSLAVYDFNAYTLEIWN